MISNLTHSTAPAVVLVVVLLAVGSLSVQAQQVLLPSVRDEGLAQASPIERSIPGAAQIPTFTRRFTNGNVAPTERESASAIIVTHSPNETNVASSGSRSTYIWGGALIGAVVTAATTAIYMNQSNKEFLGSPLAVVPVIAGGALVGALVGYEFSH